MTWTLIEPCCGSAALSVALMGGRSLMPYQGSKWSLRKPLRRLAERHGYRGRPSRVVLRDAGPWGAVWRALSGADHDVFAVIEALRSLNNEEPAALFNRLHGAPVPSCPVEYAAEFLWLQRMTFTGKAVGDRDGIWRSPGFSTTMAYGTPATDRFGEVRPQGPSLLRRLERFPWGAVEIDARRGDASDIDVGPGCLVYLDPPYDGTTGYPGGDLARGRVVGLAQGWREGGADVLVSEGEAIAALGWHATRIREARVHNGSPFKVKREEWVTHTGSAEPAQVGLFVEAA